MAKIKVQNPSCELDGDERTDHLAINQGQADPAFIDVNLEYYDLGMEYPRQGPTYRVNIDDANAIKNTASRQMRHHHPDEARGKEFG